jgi:hypothetical protein
MRIDGRNPPSGINYDVRWPFALCQAKPPQRRTGRNRQARFTGLLQKSSARNSLHTRSLSRTAGFDRRRGKYIPTTCVNPVSSKRLLEAA